MSLNYENVGKNVIYNRSVDNIEDYVKGTIVGCYIGQDEEYYVTSIESSGECIKVYDDSLIEIIEDGGSGAVSSVNGQTGTVVLDAEDVGAAQDSLKLTVTPTSGPSGTSLMSGTWSGATWEEVMQAVTASRLIQIDIDGLGPITMLYNANGATFVQSECFTSGYEDTSAIVNVALFSDNIFVVNIVALVDPSVNIVEGSVVDIQPFSNYVYKCGELTSLTVNSPPATGKYSIIFYSGATPTTTAGIANFTAEANKRYKITVEDNYATYDSWPYTPT